MTGMAGCVGAILAARLLGCTQMAPESQTARTDRTLPDNACRSGQREHCAPGYRNPRQGPGPVSRPIWPLLYRGSKGPNRLSWGYHRPSPPQGPSLAAIQSWRPMLAVPRPPVSGEAWLRARGPCPRTLPTSLPMPAIPTAGVAQAGRMVLAIRIYGMVCFLSLQRGTPLGTNGWDG
jgi:hypothetical protein